MTLALQGLDEIRADQENFYRDLHAHPELSHQESRTAAEVAARLRAAGCEVHTGVGGTGVVGVLQRGDGPGVLLRADMDALPVREETGLDYASSVTATGADGNATPVMHACGHDMHVVCLVGAVELLSRAGEWCGRLVAVFQPGEEVADGAGAWSTTGSPGSSGRSTWHCASTSWPSRPGSWARAAGRPSRPPSACRITVHGRGAHGSMPQASVDPVVLAAMIVVRLQTIIARETRPGEPAVLTVGSIQAGTKSNVIPDKATILLNLRTYDEDTRHAILTAVKRIVVAECDASRSPRPPEFELFDQYPMTDNGPVVTERVAAAFAEHFGDDAGELPLQTASEDFSVIPRALGIPYTYWGIGGTDPELYRQAEVEGRIADDVPVNHSSKFAPLLQPTLDAGTAALTVAARAFLGTA